MISENTCEVFMNDVMEVFFLQEHEINPELQIENNWNLESEKKNEKKH